MSVIRKHIDFTWCRYCTWKVE